MYGLRDVERMLGVTRAAVLSVVRNGLVRPERGPRGAYLFSFPDLVVLRAARALAAADIPPRRITRSLRRLREQLPQQLPLSGLRILADGDRVVVQDGAKRWHADSGQYLLAFDVPAARDAGLRERASGGDPGEVPGFAVKNALPPRVGAREPPHAGAARWFERGCELESKDTSAAIRAYRRALQLDPNQCDACVNLGRLLHEQGRLAEAERIYRAGLARGGNLALLQFNLAVLMEDLERREEAVERYRQALALDPGLADAHYNVSLLYEKLGMGQLALKHLREYRRLSAT